MDYSLHMPCYFAALHARSIGFAALMAINAMLIHATVESDLQILAFAATFMVFLATAWLSRHLKAEED